MADRLPNLSAPLGTKMKPKKQPKPEILELRDNIPFRKRLNVLIKPDDDKFLETEMYFLRLLRNPQMTIEKIMEAHFTPHEIHLFTPTIHNPYAAWQRQNSIEYHAMLNGRFKGKKPTLEVKLAMLYFGLMVAPMKMVYHQFVTFEDLQYLEGDTLIKTDPLEFLNEYSERTYGSESRASNRRLYSLPDTYRASLRGAGSDTDAINLDYSEYEDDSSDLWEIPAQNQPNHSDVLGSSRAVYIRMYGRQGQAVFEAVGEGFVKAIAQLLSLGSKSDVDICIDQWGAGKFLKTVNGTFLQPREAYKPHTNNHIFDFFEKAQKETHDVICFVRLAYETMPRQLSPDRDDSYAVRFVIAKSMNGILFSAYMRVPTKPTKKHKPSQYASEFLRSLKVLFPQVVHQTITLESNKGSPYGSIYPCQDPPAKFIEAIAELEKTEYPTGIRLVAEEIDPNTIPIVIPDESDFDRQRRGTYKSIMKKDLSDVDALRRILEDACITPSKHEYILIESIEVWLPAEDFQDLSVDPVVIPLQRGAVSAEGLSQPGWEAWIDRINAFKVGQPDHYTKGFAIAARPVYKTYCLSTLVDLGFDTARKFSTDLLNLDLETFKEIVRVHLWPDYNQHDKRHVLHLAGDYIASAHVVRPDTTSDGWQMILRRITADDIYIGFEVEKQWEPVTIWNVNPKSYWGPWYDLVPQAAPTKPPRIIESPATKASKKRKAELDAQTRANIDRLMGKSAKSFSGYANHVATRAQAFWDPPSIFADPLKPAIPLHGAPVETMIRTGPSVPEISMAMRTPTEMARLQREVHMLRGQIMDRVRECPYQGCSKYFHYRDGLDLDKHLKTDHIALHCFLCPSPGLNLRYFDSEAIKQHLVTDHHEELKQLVWRPSENRKRDQHPASITSATSAASKRPRIMFKFCDRCGRDQHLCNEEGDQNYHFSRCTRLNFSNEPLGTGRHPRELLPYCGTCGWQRLNVRTEERCENWQCPERNIGAPAGTGFCVTCGLNYNKFSERYRLLHKSGCKPMCGETWDFCGFCGTSLRGLFNNKKHEHGWWCPERPKLIPKQCPYTDCPITIDSPEYAQQHLVGTHGELQSCPWCQKNFEGMWDNYQKTAHFAQHLYQSISGTPQVELNHVELEFNLDSIVERCKYFDRCGVAMDSMTNEQRQRHVDMCSLDATPFYPDGRPNMNIDSVLHTLPLTSSDPENTQSSRDRTSASPKRAPEKRLSPVLVPTAVEASTRHKSRTPSSASAINSSDAVSTPTTPPSSENMAKPTRKNKSRKATNINRNGKDDAYHPSESEESNDLETVDMPGSGSLDEAGRQGGSRKRKRGPDDPVFTKPQGAEMEPEEEYIETNVGYDEMVEKFRQEAAIRAATGEPDPAPSPKRRATTRSQAMTNDHQKTVPSDGPAEVADQLAKVKSTQSRKSAGTVQPAISTAAGKKDKTKETETETDLHRNNSKPKEPPGSEEHQNSHQASIPSTTEESPPMVVKTLATRKLPTLSISHKTPNTSTVEGMVSPEIVTRTGRRVKLTSAARERMYDKANSTVVSPSESRMEGIIA